MNKLSPIFILIFLLISVEFHYAQDSRKSLESKRKDLNRQIEETSKILSSTSKSKESSLQELTMLQKQMDSRTELINVIREELDSIECVLSEKEEFIYKYVADFEKMKSVYKKVLIQLYKHKILNNNMLSIFSIEEFKKAYRKEIYLKQLEKKRSEQVMLIRQTKNQYAKEIAFLETNRNEKTTLFNENTTQKNELDKELAEKDLLVKKLKTKEKQLSNDLKVKENNRKKLNDKIEKIIKDQIASAKNKTRQFKNNTDKKIKSNASAQNAQNQSNSQNLDDLSFLGRKGRMNSPLKSGIIISKFGKQQHQVFEQVFTHNNGVDIRTNGESAVRSVHSGIVVSIFEVPGAGNAIMLKHGNYYTIYSNLATISVKSMQEINNGEKIGTVGKEIKTGDYILHFELWNGKSKENPELWINF